MTVIEFRGLGYPEFRIDAEFGDTEYYVKTSAESEWEQIDRETYLDALETSRARDAAASAAFMDSLVDAVRRTP